MVVNYLTVLIWSANIGMSNKLFRFERVNLVSQVWRTNNFWLFGGGQLSDIYNLVSQYWLSNYFWLYDGGKLSESYDLVRQYWLGNQLGLFDGGK